MDDVKKYGTAGTLSPAAVWGVGSRAHWLWVGLGFKGFPRVQVYTLVGWARMGCVLGPKHVTYGCLDT